jgi:CRP/FNR family transcriptional regulator, anaerobic regulatory protein
LTLEDKIAIEKVFKPLSFTKNTVIQREYTKPKYLYFVLNGYMRLYYLNDNGDEVTTRISKPDEFITPFLHFIHGRTTKMNTECITDSEVFAIIQDDLKKLIMTSPTFREFSVVIFEDAIEKIEKRADDLATLDAEMRYKLFIEHHSDILQNVPLKYIASHLGIKPESLSRIVSSPKNSTV